MSETRKNNLSIDGCQVKEDDHVASYKPISETGTGSDLRPKSLSKSKEKVSDEAEEKLLKKEDEAKIVTRVDMADAKFVVGDHRNGDAKIELDGNVRQFSGLTKEELLKYADDPFWVRLRWVMFALFWLLWLAMLAGAIAIIVRAPKCAPPKPRAWFEIGPLADRSSADYAALEAELPDLAQAKVQGVFIRPSCQTYDVLDPGTSCLEQFKQFLKKAQEQGIKVMVDLIANYVPTTHEWFRASENRSAEYSDYFIWRNATEFQANGKPKQPNNWVAVMNEPAWVWSSARQQYYLRQLAAGTADLNFSSVAVVQAFDAVLKTYLEAGASGVRLVKPRTLLVHPSFPDEPVVPNNQAIGNNITDYGFLTHQSTFDQPGLDELYEHWAHIVTGGQEERIFTTLEDGSAPEWYLMRHNAKLKPPSTAPVSIAGDVNDVVSRIRERLGDWPIMQLVLDEDSAAEVSRLALLLPATPTLARGYTLHEDNATARPESFAHVASLRQSQAVQHGAYALMAVPTNGSQAAMIAVARWKAGQSGYVAVFNPSSVARANLTGISSLPDTLAVHSVSATVRQRTNYTNNVAVSADAVLVPERGTVVLSYVPKTTVEQ